MKPNHVMIDLETMGLTPGCAVVSVGAVVFDPRTNTVTNKTFYEELDWRSQELDGLVVLDSTYRWWGRQPQYARRALNGTQELSAVLIKLTSWLPDDCKVWGNGSTFDISILEYCYRIYELPVPWKFWNIRDCRTIKELYECSRGGFGKDPQQATHNALEDATRQAKDINSMWREILK